MKEGNSLFSLERKMSGANTARSSAATGRQSIGDKIGVPNEPLRLYAQLTDHCTGSAVPVVSGYTHIYDHICIYIYKT